jgi:hypothetical protein
MRVGLHALGIGAGARPEVIRAVAVEAEAAGFTTLWSGEHVVLGAAAQRISALTGYCQDVGRSVRDLTLAVALSDATQAQFDRLAEAGVTEFVVVGTPPAGQAAAASWVRELAACWGTTPRP